MPSIDETFFKLKRQRRKKAVNKVAICVIILVLGLISWSLIK